MKPPPVARYQKLVDALGYWPSFHDAHVLSASLEQGRGSALIHMFRMTEDVDENGYFVLTDHHLVTLSMTGVLEGALPDDYQPDILMELIIERSGETVTVGAEFVTSKDRQITGATPCGPRGVSIDPKSASELFGALQATQSGLRGALLDRAAFFNGLLAAGQIDLRMRAFSVANSSSLIRPSSMSCWRSRSLSAGLGSGASEWVALATSFT